MNKLTVSEYIKESIQYLAKIDSLVFTTFTLDTGFFENNVLPMFFDIEDSIEKRRKIKINEALYRTHVNVFYDRNHSVQFTGKYRYQISSIKLPNRFFHPKLIIVAGEKENGIPCVLVVVLSANLTLSGWGGQEEILATLFIESGRQYNVIQQVKALLSFLEKNTGHNYESFIDIRAKLKSLPENLTLTKIADQNTELYIGGIGNNTSFFQVLTQEKMGQRWDKLYVVSPYWHDILEQASNFPAREYCMIPTRNYKGLYNLTPGQAKELWKIDKVENVEIMDFRKSKNEKYLFRHAKAYFLLKGDNLRIGIGSCNFTSHGLTGDIKTETAPNGGNVEAMLIYSEDKSILRKEILPDLKEIILTDENAEKTALNDSPQHLPFDITVVFDWRRKEFIYTYIPHKEKLNANLKLPHVEELILLNGPETERKIELESKYYMDGNFILTYLRQGETLEYYGPILEINLDESEKEYLPRLSPDEILDSWRAPTKEIPSYRESGALLNEDEVDSPNENEIEVKTEAIGDIFNYYDDFRALYDLRLKLREARAKKERRIIEGYLLYRPDSISRLIHAIESVVPIERKYCLAQGLLSILEENQKYTRHKIIAVVKYLIKSSREELLKKITLELDEYTNQKINPDNILRWFDKHIGAE